MGYLGTLSDRLSLLAIVGDVVMVTQSRRIAAVDITMFDYDVLFSGCPDRGLGIWCVQRLDKFLKLVVSRCTNVGYPKPL